MPVLPFLPLAAYEVMPFVTLTDEQLRAIVERHQLALDGPVEPMPSNGVVHSLWSLGSEYVLRVPKAETMCLGDLRAEVVAIPVARTAGVRTPALVAFDDSTEIVDVPYAIVERVHGVDLSQLAADDERLDDLYRQLGGQLAALHGAPLPDPHPWFRQPELRDIDAALAETVAAGMLSRDAQRWFRATLDAIESDEPVPVRFLHQDVKPDNLMVDVGGELVLIDWGDAGLGDAALDFAALPATAIAATLDGYRAAAGASVDPTLERRIVGHALGNAVAGLRRSPQTGPSWYRPLATGLTDLLAFATDHPATWQRWLGR